MSRVRKENSLRAVAGGRGGGSKSVSDGNLPLETTSFVGRGRELGEVEALLRRTRLLTLTGVGGSGKTRLALRVAEDLRGSFGRGAWWVEFASLPDADLVPRRVASALGVAESPGRATVDQLVEYLRPREALLVLDNCEHLVEACAELADFLLRACPGLRLLATSREPLGVAGEVSWPVPPLSLPDPERAGDQDDLLRSEAVGLFVERASAVVPGFVLGKEDASAVATVCARLDGMPLAIELAAARVRMLSARQILARLDDRFRLLKGNRTAVPRHRTLRATVDWSHCLLSAKEKVLFRRLSVFSHGWTLEAAGDVCAVDGIEEDEVFELLAVLVDRSLVVVAKRGVDEVRYRMLETVKQYASDKLAEARETEAMRTSHARFFLGLAEEAEVGLAGPWQVDWLGRLEAEHDNLRSALAWLTGRGEAERGLRLAAALQRFWWFRGHLAEGRAHLEALLGLRTGATVGDAVRGRAQHVLAVLIYRQAEYIEGDWAVARALLEDSLEVFRRLGDERHTAAVLQDLGKVNAEFGEGEAARSVLDESLEIGRRSGDRSVIALSLCYLGFVQLLAGDLPSARLRLEESLKAFRELDDKFWINACLVHLGYIDCEEGAFAAARSRFLQMFEDGSLAQFPWGATYALEGFARLEAAEGRAVRALRLAGATTALRRTFGVAIGRIRQAGFLRGLEPAWQALTEEAGKSAWEQGQKMTLEQAMDLALEDPETRPDTLRPEGPLSARELEVLSLVAEGLSDAQVAEKLYVSPRTVGGHLRVAYRKLGVKSRTAAVRRASELALI